MWWISFVIDAVILLIAIIICNIYYNNTYGSFSGQFSLTTLKGYSVLNGNLFAVTDHFSNVYCSILLKMLITFAFIFVIHATKALWPTIIYAVYFFTTWSVYSSRKQKFKEADANVQWALEPSYNISKLFPICHALFFASLYVSYILI